LEKKPTYLILGGEWEKNLLSWKGWSFVENIRCLQQTTNKKKKKTTCY